VTEGVQTLRPGSEVEVTSGGPALSGDTAEAATSRDI
jgi:hypothetical protein